MKHLLNNLSEEVKNSIREKHTGGMNVNTNRFKTLSESSLGNAKPLINEVENTTGDTVYNDYISKGYKDITSYYFSPEGVVYIPDGDYVGKGWGYSEDILTKDGKPTGYVFMYDAGVRGQRNSNVKVANNGGGIGSSGGKISKVLLNDTILNSSGLKKK